MAQLYDPCPTPGCPGHLGVVDTYFTDDGEYRVRLLGCRTCKQRPEENKVLVPIAHAPPRPTRLQISRLAFTRRGRDDD